MRSWAEPLLLLPLLLAGCDDTLFGPGVHAVAPAPSSPTDSAPSDSASPPEADSGAACGAELSWDLVGAPFMYTWCTMCHSPLLEDPDTGSDLNRQGAPEYLNLTLYDDVVPYLALIEARVFPAEGVLPMPPAGGPTEEELAHFQAWLDCGAPE